MTTLSEKIFKITWRKDRNVLDAPSPFCLYYLHDDDE